MRKIARGNLINDDYMLKLSEYVKFSSALI